MFAVWQLVLSYRYLSLTDFTVIKILRCVSTQDLHSHVIVASYDQRDTGKELHECVVLFIAISREIRRCSDGWYSLYSVRLRSFVIFSFIDRPQILF